MSERVIAKWSRISAEERTQREDRFNAVIQRFADPIEPIQDFKGVTTTEIGIHTFVTKGIFSSLIDGIEFREGHRVDRKARGVETTSCDNSISLTSVVDLGQYEHKPLSSIGKTVMEGLLFDEYPESIWTESDHGYFRLLGKDRDQTPLVDEEGMDILDRYLEIFEGLAAPDNIAPIYPETLINRYK